MDTRRNRVIEELKTGGTAGFQLQIANYLITNLPPLDPATLRPFGVDRVLSPSASSGSGFRTKLLPSSVQPADPEGVGHPAHIPETDALHPPQHFLSRRAISHSPD